MKILLVLGFLMVLTFSQVWAASKRTKICLQPMQSGRCFGHVESFAYNPFTRKCESFIYGGCGGNENRFKSRSECEFNCRDI